MSGPIITDVSYSGLIILIDLPRVLFFDIYSQVLYLTSRRLSMSICHNFLKVGSGGLPLPLILTKRAHATIMTVEKELSQK